MIATHVKKYRGAHILILNEWQTFIAIIFYKGKFYHAYAEAIKKGEYGGKEYTECVDFAYREAKRVVDAIKISKRQRSILGKILIKLNVYKAIKVSGGREPEQQKDQSGRTEAVNRLPREGAVEAS